MWHVPIDRADASGLSHVRRRPESDGHADAAGRPDGEGVSATFFLSTPISHRTLHQSCGACSTRDTRWGCTPTSDGSCSGRRNGSPTRLRAGGEPDRAACRLAAVRLFRPHAGWRSATMYKALDLLDYRLAGWSWGLWDWNWWRPREAVALADRLARRANDGDIIVMHDGHHIDPATRSAIRNRGDGSTRAGASATRSSTSETSRANDQEARFRWS